VDRDPIKTAVRNAKREQRLGSDAACGLCGLAELAALRVVTDPALIDAVLQALRARHHPGCRAHDSELTIILCLNCHAIVTESQLRGAVPMVPQPNELERQIARQRALATFFQDLADAEDRAAEALEGFRDFLDAEFPEWRERWKR